MWGFVPQSTGDATLGWSRVSGRDLIFGENLCAAHQTRAARSLHAREGVDLLLVGRKAQLMYPVVDHGFRIGRDPSRGWE